MAILRSLLVNMGLNSSQYKEELKRTQKQTKTSFNDMSKAVTAYASAGTAALAASVVASSKMVRNQQNMARVSNMTVQEYNSMSFAASQYGLTAESIAGVSKDAIEKIGEYINSGGGGLQDFADAMNMSKRETLEWAQSVQGMSGIDIFKKMIAEMEEAGLSTAQMSNALESMGSEATNLIPLFENNGAEIERLTGKYNQFNQELSPEQIENYRKTAENIDLMTVSIKQMTATALEPAIKEVYEFMKVWETMGDRRASYGLRTEIDVLAKESRELKEKISGGTGWFYDEEDLAEDKARLAEIQQEYIQKTDELQKLREKNQPTFGDLYGGQDLINIPVKVKRKTSFENEVNDEETQTWGDIYSQTDTVDLYELNMSKQQAAEAKALSESLRLSTETLGEKHDRETALLEQGLSDHQEFLEAKVALDDEYWEEVDRRSKETSKMQREEAMNLLGFTSQMLSITTDMLKGAGEESSAVYKALFLAQKAAAIPSMIISTQEAYAGALAAFPAMPWIAESVRGMGYASIGIAAGQAIAGVAHGGIDEIPGYGKDQTWLLQGGERIVSKEQNQDLKNYMKNGNQPVAGGNVTIQVMGNIYGDEQTEKIMSESAQRGYKMVYDDARSNGPVSNQFRR